MLLKQLLMICFVFACAMVTTEARRRGRDCSIVPCTREDEVCTAQQREDGTTRNVCLKSCTVTSDCRKGSTCTNGVCQGLQRCTTDGESVCSTGTTCIPKCEGQTWGKCTPPCNNDQECPEETTCNTGTNVCEDSDEDESDSCERPGRGPGRDDRRGPGADGRRGPSADGRRGPGRGNQRVTCSGPADCDTTRGEVCAPEEGRDGMIQNVCLKGCTVTRDCRKGSTCRNGVCQGLQRCTTDDDCAADALCIRKRESDSEGKCKPLCISDNDCPEETTCNVDTNVCDRALRDGGVLERLRDALQRQGNPTGRRQRGRPGI